MENSSDIHKEKSTNNKRPFTQPKDTISISRLNPYLPKWKISATVTFKSPVKRWEKDGKPKQLFAVNLLDDSGEIRCTVFDELCEKFDDIIQVGKSYTITNCSIRKAITAYNDLGHVYELNLNVKSIFELSDDPVAKKFKLTFDFKTIEFILGSDDNTIIDFIAIIKEIGDVEEITKKSTSKIYKKRDIQLIDHTNQMIILNLWEDRAFEFNHKAKDIVAIKRVKISVYNDIRKLTAKNSTIIIDNYEGEEKTKLLEWMQKSDLLD